MQIIIHLSNNDILQLFVDATDNAVTANETYKSYETTTYRFLTYDSHTPEVWINTNAYLALNWMEQARFRLECPNLPHAYRAARSILLNTYRTSRSVWGFVRVVEYVSIYKPAQLPAAAVRSVGGRPSKVQNWAMMAAAIESQQQTVS